MRLLASIIVALVTSAVALFIAAAVLSDFDVSTLTFPILVVEFAVILLIARAAIETIVDKNVHVLSSFVGLIGLPPTLTNFPRSESIREVLAWLDRYLGPVTTPST